MAIKKATTLLPAKNATDWAAVIIATGLGSGYSPVAPGTAGTILAVPLYILLTFYLQISLISYLIFTLIIIIIGSITAQRAGKHFGQVDAGHIVIDEIAGFLVTMTGITLSWPSLLVGFALFRIFDIWKPWPVRYFDRNVANGFGVVMDDVVAGLYALLIMQLLKYLQIF